MTDPLWPDIVSDSSAPVKKPKRMRFPRIRQWLPMLAIVIGIFGTAIALVWFLWVPQYRPGLQNGERFGIDVSAHQGEVHWNKVADDNIDFAYIKASEGGTLTDERFAANWAGAKTAKLDRGAYHFFTLCTAGSAQAKRFLDTLPADIGELPSAVDLELSGNCSKRPSNAVVQRELRDFIAAVEVGTGRKVVLYVGDDFEEKYPVTDTIEAPLWLRRYLQRPEDERWVVWQATGRAAIEGISGAVDLDVQRTAAG